MKQPGLPENTEQMFKKHLNRPPGRYETSDSRTEGYGGGWHTTNKKN